MSDFLDTPITDCHVHLRSSDGIDPLMQLLDDCRMSKADLVCTAGTRRRGLANNAVGMLCKALHPDRTYLFGGLQYPFDGEPSPQDLREQAEQLWAAGCDGMKMIEGKPTSRKRIGFALDDPVYDEYYAYLESERIPILYHVADPETFWDPERIPPGAKTHGWDYTDGSFPAKERLYREIDRMLEKFPKLRIIFAHFYFMSAFPDRASALMDRWPEISFDITPGSEMYRNFSKTPDRWQQFFTTYQDRILFGTDNGAPSPADPQRREAMIGKVWMMRMFLEKAEEFEGFCSATVRTVTGLGLDREVLEKIYHKNFQRYTGRRPRTLDLPAAVNQCQRLIDRVASTLDDEGLLSELKNTHQRMQAAGTP